MKMSRTRHAGRIGGSRGGGSGNTYERTDPDWERTRLMRMKAEYLSLDTYWRERYMDALHKGDRAALVRALEEKP